jgi:hypothetical protein
MYIRPKSTETPAIPTIAIKLAAVAIRANPRSRRLGDTFGEVMMFPLDLRIDYGSTKENEGNHLERSLETPYRPTEGI